MEFCHNRICAQVQWLTHQISPQAFFLIRNINDLHSFLHGSPNLQFLLVVDLNSKFLY